MTILAEALAAERALGRLDQACTDTATAHRHRGDAARRSAAAIVRLSGDRLDVHDFQTALAAPDHADGAALQAALFATLLQQLQNGLTAGGMAALALRHDDALTLDPRLSDERRALMENAMAADTPSTDGWDEPSMVEVGPEPWSVPWLEELHRRWSLIHLGRAEPLPAVRQADALTVLEEITAVLEQNPGVLGAAAAFRLLAARPDPIGDGHGPGWWAMVAWLTAPDLLRRACSLRHAWAPLAVLCGRDATGFRLALSGSTDDWQRWFLGAVQDMADHELERLRALALTHERWQARLAALNLRNSSRLPDVVDWLFEQPAFTVKRAQPLWKARFDLSERGCHLLTRQLAKAGIVAEHAGPGGERVWAADLSFLPAGR